MKRSRSAIDIEAVKRRLIWPRLQVSLILSLTALAAFLASVVMLNAGVHSMGIRYTVATAFAYGVFLLLLKVWISAQTLSDPDVPIDGSIPDLGYFDAPAVDGGVAAGDFGGGGSGGSWGPADTSATSESLADVSAGSWDLDLDELALIVLAVVVAVGGLFAVFYVVYVAPALLAEILIDGVLAGGLYRTVRRAEPQHWLRTALRKTAVPAVLAVTLFGTSGFLLQRAVPEARTLGAIWKDVTHK